MANEYGEIENLVNDVTSLDTARMTLRWALERLNTIEKEKADLKKNLTLAEETSKRLQLKEASLTDAYSSRNKNLEEKEDFYTKLEATMSLLGEGKLDIQQLLKKEAKLDSLRHSLENEYSDKFEELDRNQRSVIERWNSRLLEVESQYAGRLAEAQKKYDGLRSELESDYQGRMNSLQTSFTSREKYLTERIGGLEKSVHLSEEKVETRRRELEGEYLIKKREAEENYRKLRNMLEAGLEEKIRAADSDHAEQVRAFEASWQIERARLLEEQHVREAQYASAQDRIKEIENALATQQETHHSELLKIISEKETAFRAQLAALEAEKSSKEETVRELQARLEKKADVWEADRARLQAEFDGRLGSMEAGLRERAVSLEETFQRREKELDNVIAASRAEFEQEFAARLAEERQAMDAEKARLEEQKREREEALAVNSARLKELEKAIAATREEHHKDLMERISAGEASFREKLAGFEAEKRVYNETINKLTDEIRQKEGAVLGEKKKIAAEFEAKAAIYEERLARAEELFEGKRQAYEGKIAALSARIEEAVRASALEKDNFNAAIARVSAEAEALAAEQIGRNNEIFEEKQRAYEEKLAALSARIEDAAKASELEKENFRNGIARVSAEMAALAEERLAAREKAFEEKLAALSLKLEEAARASALEKENFKNGIARVSAETEALAEERMAGIRADYEARKAELEKEFSARYSDRLKALAAEKSRVEEVLAERESQVSAAKAAAVALEADYAVKRERLEAEAAVRMEAIYAEVESKIAAERKNWHAERSRFENMLAETYENFNTSQTEIGALNAKLRRAAEENAEREARFNRELFESKVGYEKELSLRIKESVSAQTADLVEALEVSRAVHEELTAALGAKESSIIALKNEVTEVKRDCEARLLSAVSEAVAARRRELETAYTRRQTALEEDFKARCDALTAEFALKNGRLEEENASFKAELGKATAAATESNARAVMLGDKLLAAEKAFHNEKIEIQKAQISELENTVADAVSAAVEMAEDRLRHSQEELDKAKKTNREEVRQLAEGFNAEKDQLLEELGRRDRYIEDADAKVQELEHEMLEYRQTASGELMKNISEQDGRFREMAAAEKARSDARIKQLETLLSAKEMLLADSDKFYRQKQLELDSLHNSFNMRVNGFNEDIFAQKQALSEKEKAVNEFRLKLEKDYALKASELEGMKAELTRAIIEYRKK